jgi:hypothetical protein
MNTRFVELLPELATAVAGALRDEGYTEVADTLASQAVEKCTYDPQANAGYVYLVQQKPVHHSETPAAETVAFAAPHWFNVDLRASGAVFGIELLSPSPAFKAIAKRPR